MGVGCWDFWHEKNMGKDTSKNGLFPLRIRQQKGVCLLKALGFFVVFVKESLMTHPEDL